MIRISGKWLIPVQMPIAKCLKIVSFVIFWMAPQCFGGELELPKVCLKHSLLYCQSSLPSVTESTHGIHWKQAYAHCWFCRLKKYLSKKLPKELCIAILSVLANLIGIRPEPVTQT
jgi:hypothetical protein